MLKRHTEEIIVQQSLKEEKKDTSKSVKKKSKSKKSKQKGNSENTEKIEESNTKQNRIINAKTMPFRQLIESWIQQITYTVLSITSFIFIQIQSKMQYICMIIDEYIARDTKNKENIKNIETYKEADKARLITRNDKKRSTIQTDRMITHTNEEIYKLSKVPNIIRETIQLLVPLSKNSIEFIDFVSERIQNIQKILHTYTEECTGNIADIQDFSREQMKYEKLIKRYEDELKNTNARYNLKEVIFHQPIIEVKHKLLLASNAQQALLDRLSANDVWIEVLFKEIAGYIEEKSLSEDTKTKEFIILFQIVTCAIASAHLAMYELIDDIKSQTNDFLQNNLKT